MRGRAFMLIKHGRFNGRVELHNTTRIISFAVHLFACFSPDFPCPSFSQEEAIIPRARIVPRSRRRPRPPHVWSHLSTRDISVGQGLLPSPLLCPTTSPVFGLPLPSPLPMHSPCCCLVAVAVGPSPDLRSDAPGRLPSSPTSEYLNLGPLFLLLKSV